MDTSYDLAVKADGLRQKLKLLQAYCRLVQHMRTAQEIYWQEAMRRTPNETARINALAFARNLERAVDEETFKMLESLAEKRD